ncbi:MAG: outer membrane beta-barrel protein [bacterium]
MKVKRMVIIGLVVLGFIGSTSTSAQYQDGRYYQSSFEHLAYGPGVIQISPFGGFMMGDEYEAYSNYPSTYGRIRQDDSAVWGVRAGFGLLPLMGLEFQYSQANTTFYTVKGGSFSGSRKKLSDVNVRIFLANLNFDFYEGNIVPYFALGMGTTVYDIKSGHSESEFTGTAAGGVKARISPNIALRFEVRSYLTQVRDTMYSSYWDGYNYHWESYEDTYLYTWDSTLGLSFIL